MMYRKSFAKNNKKPKANSKRQCRKPQSLHAVNSSLKTKKENKKRKISAPLTLSANSIVIILLITAMGLIGLYYQSIKIYWQQTYHFDLFHSNANVDNDTLDLGNSVNAHGIAETPKIGEHSSVNNQPVNHGNRTTSISKDNTQASPSSQHQETKKGIDTSEKEKIQQSGEANHNVSTNSNSHSEGVKHSDTQVQSPIDNQLSSNSEPDTQIAPTPSPIVLTSHDKVFFAGDSLMQGVAPYVKKMLFKQYKIESLDLSKQSTGFAYPKAFNWPKAVEDNLVADPSIKLLIVFLGANDPWDFPVEGYTQYARFKSELWEAQYRLRIDSVLSSAKAHNVSVLWLAAPCMRKPKLNDGMVYLNTLYQSELTKAGQHFLTTNDLLGCTYEKFSNFVEKDNEKIKVRIDDGIHFTPSGQKILAKAIMDQITFKELEDSNND